MAEIVLRLVFSLAVVLGLLMVTARVARGRLRGPADAPVRVLHRQGLSRGSSVVVVAVGERLLLLGATEHQVQVLTELSPAELAVGGAPMPTLPTVQAVPTMQAVPTVPGVAGAAPASASSPFGRLLHQAEAYREPAPARPGRHVARRPAAPAAGDDAGPLSGSLLSPRTWRQAAQAVAGRAS
jgi:flagellar protein FliO/FliZ